MDFYFLLNKKKKKIYIQDFLIYIIILHNSSVHVFIKGGNLSSKYNDFSKKNYRLTSIDSLTDSIKVVQLNLNVLVGLG